MENIIRNKIINSKIIMEYYYQDVWISVILKNSSYDMIKELKHKIKSILWLLNKHSI